MSANLLKQINITEQINAYIREHRFQEILGNKKADTVRQDEMSASNTKPNKTHKGAIQHEPV